MNQHFDVIVVGAGLAGSATAGLVARQGARVLLLDQARFPRNKTCGEGLMPSGVEILERTAPRLKAERAQSFSGLLFFPIRGPAIHLPFRAVSAAAEGWVFPRRVLDAGMAAWAADHPRVHFRQGVAVQTAASSDREVLVTARSSGGLETFRGRLLVGSDGLRSRLHRPFGIERERGALSRFALGARFRRLREVGTEVEVHCSGAGEAYVAPLGDGSVRMTLLLHGPGDHRRGARPADLYGHYLARFPRLLKRLEDPRRPLGEVEAAAPASFGLSRCHAQRLLLVGDAAGAVDPVTGQGMSLALKDAQLAAGILGERLGEDRLSEEELRPYSLMRNRYFRPAHHLAGRLLASMQRPDRLERAGRALESSPSLRRRLTALAMDPGPANRLRLTDQLRLFLGR